MATLKSIQFKRSKTPGAKPTAAQLDEGELAINLRDRTIFTKSDQGQIIDLGFAKGGQVDGDVTINGTLNLNGPEIVASGGYIEFNYRTTGSGSWAGQHNAKAPIFADLSAAASTSEYNPLIKQRFKDGTFSAGTLVSEGSFKFHYINEAGDSKYWTFNRNGNFQIDTGGLMVSAGNISASGNINSANGVITGPEIVTKNINFSTKSFVANANIGYDWVSLPTWVYNPPADGSDDTTNGLNYLRKLRASSASSIFHEIADCRKGKPQEISWWTGVGPSSFQWAFDNSGRITAGKSISVGLPDNGANGRYPLDSAISIGIAIGDNDTGIKWVRDGVIDFMANGISSATILNNGINSTKKLMVGYSRDSGSTWDFPNNNQAMFTARTDVDGNNNGDGQTHIGYSSNSKMYHYFRGTGRMAVGMSQGLLVEPGILDINTGSNRVAIRADGTFDSTQRISMRTGLFFGGDDNTNALSFKAPTGVDGTKTINWDAGTRNGQNKNTITLKAWGNSFNSTPGNRETVFEVSDSQGYYFYAQRTNPAPGETIGPVNFKFNGTVETGHIIGLGNISASGTGSFGGNVTMSNGLFVQGGGATFNGQVKMGGTADALRIWNAEYGMIFRRSETGSSASFHFIPTLQNGGENGGISDLRPLSINLANGTVIMGNKSGGGYGPLFTVDNVSKFVQTDCRLRVNMDSDAIVVNASSQASSNFIQGRKADVTKWYLGIGDGGNVVRLHNYTYSHGIALNSDTVDITKPLKIGSDIRIGTDGNIIGSTTLPNFHNLNTTLDRKVNTGGWGAAADDGWYKFATVNIPQSVGTAIFRIYGGSGFNFKSHDQATATEIVLRTGNGNPKGLNAVLWTRTFKGFTNIATVNTSDDNYDVYVYIQGYSNSMIVEHGCSSNSSVTVVGLNGGVQPVVPTLPEGHVVGKVSRLLNNIDGNFAAGESDIVTRGEYVTNNQKGLRIKSSGNDIGSNAAILRNDGGSFYILATDKNTAEKADAANGDWNGLRPFSINMVDGRVGMNHGLNITGGGLNVAGGLNVTSGNTSLGNISSRVVAGWRGAAGWGDTSDTMKSKITFMADHGDLSNSDSYYPIVGAWSNYGSAGYRQTFEFGWHGSGTTAGWRDGIIRIRGDNANSQQARWRFTMDGILDCPGKVLLPQTSAFGINTTNGFGGNSLVIGDSDTGFKQVGDGLLEVWTNGARRMRFQTGDTYSDMNINAPNVYIRSDIRLKSNFKPIENALDKVEQLEGLIYDKADYIGGEVVHTEAGVIAQNLEKVLPEAIREVDDIKGNKVLTVSTQAQVALLIEAVKTLSAKVRELEAKLN